MSKVFLNISIPMKVIFHIRAEFLRQNNVNMTDKQLVEFLQHDIVESYVGTYDEGLADAVADYFHWDGNLPQRVETAAEA